MKKHIFSFVALLFAAQMAWAAAVTPAAGIPAYWESVDGKASQELWAAISSRTNYGYSSIGYKGLYAAYLKTDVYPADSVGRAGMIWDMYGECEFAPKKTCGSYNSVCDCYNREHSIPQSWWGGGTSGIGNDIFHVLPTDGKVNGVRSNYEYGEVNGGSNWVGNKFGAADSWSTDKKTIASEADEEVQGTGQVFEPKPQYKGDIARGLLGTIIKWQQSNLTTNNNFFNGSYTPSGNFGLTKKAVVLLMKWHREDPVSQKEIDRNNGIQETQGNRNPFIDYPYLAEYIWGEHAGETVDMSRLMASTDTAFIPGVSDGWRTDTVPPTPPTPPAPTVKYGVTWTSNGTELYTDSIEENKPIVELPLAPLSCSSESDVFVGWTDAPIQGQTDEAPAVLYVKPAEFPVVTEDVTYYAVFAKMTEEPGSEPMSITYSADSPIADWMNTAPNKGSYWLLDEGKELVSPAIDLSGLTNVVAMLRTYGGSQFDQFAIAVGDTTLGTIEVTNGSTLTEYTWENTKSLSGLSPLTFTCSNAESNKGVGFSFVTINIAGAGVSYSRYITNCQGPQEIELVETEAPVRKILVGGHLFILRDGHIYNVHGARVK